MLNPSPRTVPPSQSPNRLSIWPKPQGQQRYRSIFVGWILTLTLLAGIIWLVPLYDVWRALQRINPFLVGLAMGPVLLNLWLRSIRWTLLFRPHAEISARTALSPVLIGLGLNAVIPGRVGDIARVALGARKFGTSIPLTASTVVGERLMDALTLLAFLSGSFLLLPQTGIVPAIEFSGYSISSDKLLSLTQQIGLGIVCLIGLGLSLLIPACRRLLVCAFGRLPGIGPQRRLWVEHAVEEARRGLSFLTSPPILCQTLLFSLLIWLSIAMTNLLVSKAMPGIDLNFRQILVMTSISVAVSFLPSAPGAWGVYEAGCLLALALVRVNPEPGVGVAFAFASHFCQYLPTVVLSAIVGFQHFTNLKGQA